MGLVAEITYHPSPVGKPRKKNVGARTAPTFPGYKEPASRKKKTADYETPVRTFSEGSSSSGTSSASSSSSPPVTQASLAQWIKAKVPKKKDAARHDSSPSAPSPPRYNTRPSTKSS